MILTCSYAWHLEVDSPFIHSYIHSLSIPLFGQGSREAEANLSWFQARGEVHSGQVTNLSQGWHRDQQPFTLTFTSGNESYLEYKHLHFLHMCWDVCISIPAYCLHAIWTVFSPYRLVVSLHRKSRQSSLPGSHDHSRPGEWSKSVALGQEPWTWRPEGGRPWQQDGVWDLPHPPASY